MDNKRYPKICLNTLNKLAQKPSTKLSLNWVMQLTNVCREINPNFTIPDSIEDLTKSRDNIIKMYIEKKRSEDKARVFSSSFLAIYTQLKLQESNINYLNIRMPLRLYRVYAQCRLMGYHFGRLIVNNNYLKFESSTTQFCRHCNEQTFNNIEHFLIYCKKFSEPREKYIGASHSSIDQILNVNDTTIIKKLYYYLVESMKIINSTTA